MKKIVLASLIALSSQLALAATTQETINPEFAKIEEMVKANNMTGHVQLGLFNSDWPRHSEE